MESTSEGRAAAKEEKVTHAVSQQTEEKMHQVFDSLDANHNGRLEVPELKVRPYLPCLANYRAIICNPSGKGCGLQAVRRRCSLSLMWRECFAGSDETPGAASQEQGLHAGPPQACVLLT